MLAAVAVTLAFVGWIAAVQSGGERLFYASPAKGRTAEFAASQPLVGGPSQSPGSHAALAIGR